MSDRGVSEVLGFVLVFALVTAMIGVVYASGFSGLVALERSEQLSNMERAFDVFDDNTEDLYRRGAPSRATEIKLPGGTLRFGDTVRIDVSVVNTSDPNHNGSFSISTTPVVYDDGEGTRLVYVGGALIRDQTAGAVMLSKPPFRLDTDWTVLPLLLTYQEGGSSSIGGRTTLLVFTDRFSQTVEGDFQSGTGGQANVSITIESPRADAWAGYFEGEAGVDTIDGDPADGNVTYRYTTDRLVVSQTVIAVKFDL